MCADRNKKRVENESVCDRFFIKGLLMKKITILLTILFSCVVGNVAASSPEVPADLAPKVEPVDAAVALEALSVADKNGDEAVEPAVNNEATQTSDADDAAKGDDKEADDAGDEAQEPTDKE